MLNLTFTNDSGDDDGSVERLLGLAMFRPDSHRIRRRRSEYQSRPRQTLMLARRGEHVCGLIGFRRSGERVIVQHLAVAPSERRRGLGRALVARVQAMDGVEQVEAETDAAARGFYERCGFLVESLGEKHQGVERFLCRRRTDGEAPEPTRRAGWPTRLAHPPHRAGT